MNFRTLAYRSLITVHRSLITVYRSLVTAYRSLITVHRSLFTVCCLLFTAYCLPLTVVAGTELGATDDFTVLGTDGTVDDPDVEIKGFTIFGSTNVLTHISTAAGNTVFNGAVEVSSDIYIVGKSTFIDNAYFAGAGNIFVNDGADGQILRYNSGGYLEWVDASSFGDDLGDHIATEQLQMGNYAIWSSSDITAARYQINGSTVVAILPGSESMGIGVNAGRVNTGDYNVFVGSAAGYSNTTGYRNSFVGYQAGYSNITGYDNAFLGAYAGYYNQTGASNAILGTEAGYGVSLNSFSSSTLMGYRAGYGLTTGSGNLLLGFQSGDNLTTGSRNIIIGHDKNA
ncbi:MAG: hypothetical protein L6420_09635, partial [Elusimicrobia bacterium]|nr:hypothetical protein [Elusimicrobiota bacterium]